MELIIISESKIKLMLTEADMSSYNGSTKEILSGIMDDVRNKCGLTGMNGRIFIQMYPSKGGGCEMFVTKLSDLNKTASLDQSGEVLCLRSGEEKVVTEYRKYIYGERGKYIIYAFDEMGYLLSCCRDLSRFGHNGVSSAYADRGRGKFYLLLDRETHLAGENFGKLCQSREFYYINEHCDMICENDAVYVLGRFA